MPRKPLYDDSTIDCGEYGPEATENPGTEPQTRSGRPPGYEWPEINPLVSWYVTCRHILRRDRLKQETFIEGVQYWCKEETGGQPSHHLVEQRIQELGRVD
jgi:hypothetical protein